MATSAEEYGRGPCDTEGCETVISGLEDGYPNSSGRLACRSCWYHWIVRGCWPDEEVPVDGE